MNIFKILLALLTVSIIGCVTETSYKNKVEFDIENAEYESLTLNRWKPETKVCVELIPLEGHFGEEWLPAIGITFATNDDRNIGHIEFVQSSKNSKMLQLQIRSWTEEDTGNDIKQTVYIESHPYKKALKLQVSLVDTDILKVTYLKEEILYPLDFVPEKVKLGASSISGIIQISRDKCL